MTGRNNAPVQEKLPASNDEKSEREQVSDKGKKQRIARSDNTYGLDSPGRELEIPPMRHTRRQVDTKEEQASVCSLASDNVDSRLSMTSLEDEIEKLMSSRWEELERAERESSVRMQRGCKGDDDTARGIEAVHVRRLDQHPVGGGKRALADRDVSESLSALSEKWSEILTADEQVNSIGYRTHASYES